MKYENMILDAIETVIERKMKDLKFNYYIEGKITVAHTDGSFDVDYNEQTLPKLKPRAGLSLSVGDIVLINVVNGNFSNKYIDCIRP